jgi:UDP-3-O-[3-hydroxymyristoyl] glucosamine N-acyltransferase
VSKYAEIGEGTVVMHQAFVNAGAKIGNNVILNTFSNVEHDAIIGDQCHISTGVMVNGDCKVGNNVFVGSQSVLANGITIDDDIIIGAGSFVRKSLKTKGIYSGNPAILKIKAK